MIKIDEQIQWYDQNATRKDDDIIKVNLKLVETLYNEVQYSEDIIIIDKIIGTFCEIMEIQRDVINDIIMEAEQGAFCTAPTQHNYMTSKTKGEAFTDDKSLQQAFTTYCINNGKSSYTINDYCSRIKNLWKSFYAQYLRGELPDDIMVSEEEIDFNCPFLNAYYHTDELSCYLSMKIAESDGNRNLANTRAALNKFDEFKLTNKK